MDKGLDPHIRPEGQTLKPTVTQTEVKTLTYKCRVGQGRAGLGRKAKMVTSLQPKQEIPSIAEKQKPEIVTQPQVISQTAHRQPLSPKVVTRQVPSYPDPYLKPPPRPPD